MVNKQKRIILNENALSKIQKWRDSVELELNGAKIPLSKFVNSYIESIGEKLTSEVAEKLKHEFYNPAKALDFAVGVIKRKEKEGERYNPDDILFNTVGRTLAPRRRRNSSKKSESKS